VRRSEEEKLKAKIKSNCSQIYQVTAKKPLSKLLEEKR
jgi:hypothetical protein